MKRNKSDFYVFCILHFPYKFYMNKKKFSQGIVAVAVAFLGMACSESATQHQAKNPFAKNNIQSYEVTVMYIDPVGIEEGDKLIKRVEFDENGNPLTEIEADINYTTVNTYNGLLLAESVMTNADGVVINTLKMDYKGNMVRERNFGESDTPSRIRTLYNDAEGRDTLSVYTTADDHLLYKLFKKYDSIGLKESVMYTSDDTTYTKRVNDDKIKQIFESSRPDGTLIYRETKTYDEKGNETEFLFEGLTTPGIKDISHHKTTYLDNGLIDNILYCDEVGNGVKREIYQYKEFDK